MSDLAAENKELREKLRIEEEAVKLLNENLKEMFQRLKKAQRTASDFQERYNGLVSENKELQNKLDIEEEVIKLLVEEMNIYEEENRTLVEVARFYGEPNNWLAREMWSKGEGEALADDYSIEEHEYEGNLYESEVGGKKARETLKKLGYELD